LPPASKVIESIERLGGTVTAVAVAMDTGLRVEACEDELRALMVRCSGEFEMSGEAEAESVRFKFPFDLRRRAQRAEEQEQWAATLQSAGACTLGLLQSAFGLMLIMSLTIVILCLAAVVTAAFVASHQSSGSGRGGRGSGGGGGVGRFFNVLSNGRFGAWGYMRLWNEVTMIYWIFGGQNPFFQPLPPFWSPLGMLLWSRRSGQRFGARRRWASDTWRPRPAAPAVAVVTPVEGAVARVTMVDGVAVRVPDERPDEDGSGDVATAFLLGPGGGSGSGGSVGGAVGEDTAADASPLRVIHSFVFGDEPPGHHRERQAAAWRVVGRHIIRKRCSLPARDLFPFLLEPPSLGLAAPPSAAAPILAHFRGASSVDPRGGCLRCAFPELSTHDAARALAPGGGEEGPSTTQGLSQGCLVECLEEPPRVFSSRPREHLVAAAALGTANLAGVLWLRGALAGGLLPVDGAPLAALVHRCAGVLVAYAWAFLALPLCRAALLAAANRRAANRNAARRAMAEELARSRE